MQICSRKIIRTNHKSCTKIAEKDPGRYIAGGSEIDEMAFLMNSSGPGVGQGWEVDWGNPIHAVDISADGRWVVLGCETGGTDGVVVVLDKSPPTLDPIDKSDEYSWNYTTEGIVNSVSITDDGQYIVVGTDYDPVIGADNESTVFLFENEGYTVGEEHLPEWFFNTSYDVNSVSISAYGNHFAAGGLQTSGRTYLFYHARPPPPPLGLPRPDDDDDEKAEEINLLLIGLIIGSVSAGVAAVIIAVSLKKRKR